MSAEFANQLRARDGVVRLAPPGDSQRWLIRVQVAEAWDMIRVEVAPGTPVGTVKQAALDILLTDSNDPEHYEVKLRGVLVDEGATLQDAGIRHGSSLLVIARRKRPVR